MRRSIQHILRERLTSALTEVLGEATECAPGWVRPCNDPRHGDYQFNGALALAKPLRRNPRELAEARSAASYAEITATLDGRVVERYAEPGDTAVPGTPLLKLYDPSALRLEADVRESLAASLAVGDSLDVHIDATGEQRRAAIEEIVPSADPGSRSFVVKLTLGEARGLYPGMYGRVAIPTGQVRELRIPAAAVMRVGQLEYVSVRTADVIERRFVRSGRSAADGTVEVLSGLDAGEQVVVPDAP